MAAPVPLRSDFDAESLRSLAKGARDLAQTRRLLALSAIYAGGASFAAAALGGVGLQTMRDWVVAFNAYGPDELIGGNAPGARPHLTDEQGEVLRATVEQGPMPADGPATASSHPTPTSSTTAAKPETPSSTNPGASCRSDYAPGVMGSDQ